MGFVGGSIMQAARLFAQLTIYYVILFGGAWLVIHNYPEMQSYLPIGGAEQLINSGGGKSNTLEAVAQAQEVRANLTKTCMPG